MPRQDGMCLTSYLSVPFSIGKSFPIESHVPWWEASTDPGQSPAAGSPTCATAPPSVIVHLLPNS